MQCQTQNLEVWKFQLPVMCSKISTNVLENFFGKDGIQLHYFFNLKASEIIGFP
jgi:hypothetical protein